METEQRPQFESEPKPSYERLYRAMEDAFDNADYALARDYKRKQRIYKAKGLDRLRRSKTNRRDSEVKLIGTDGRIGWVQRDEDFIKEEVTYMVNINSDLGSDQIVQLDKDAEGQLHVCQTIGHPNLNEMSDWIENANDGPISGRPSESYPLPGKNVQSDTE